MKTISEVLEEFDNLFVDDGFIEEMSVEKYHRFLRTAISELLDGVVPDKQNVGDPVWLHGHGACRSDVLKRVREAKR